MGQLTFWDLSDVRESNVGRYTFCHTSVYNHLVSLFPTPTCSMDSRNPRLKKIFDDVLSGERQLTGSLVPHFIRSISTHPDPVTCLHALVTSEHGLKAVQIAICSNPSTEFLNGDVAVLLAYLRDSKLEHLGGGDTLQRFLRALMESPNFWNSLKSAFSAGQLQQSAERSFSWLLLELVLLLPELAEKRPNTASGPNIVDALLRSPDLETRANARKINHIVLFHPDDEAVPPDWPEALGWRHNNDPHSYRKISILPTPDEITSTERPYLRTVDEIDDLKLTSPIEMFKVHVENQFRLLREDLVHDTRENVQVALGNKRGKHIGDTIAGLVLTDIYADDKSKWGLAFTCSDDLPILRSAIKNEDRKDRLEKDRNYLRHGSFACLLSGNEIVAFVTIIRDVRLLARNPPVIAVQLGGSIIIKDTLSQLRRCSFVSLAQISTPLFAYEPVLRSLQAMPPIPFVLDGTLLAKPHRSRAAPGDLSDIDQEDVSDLIRDLRTSSDPQTSITLDDAQMRAFICGLTQKVALIQGPPGIHFARFCQIPSDSFTRPRNGEIIHRGPTRQSIPRADKLPHCGLLLHEPCPRSVSRRPTETGDPGRAHCAPRIEAFTQHSKHGTLSSNPWVSVQRVRLGAHRRYERVVKPSRRPIAACVLRFSRTTEPLKVARSP